MTVHPPLSTKPESPPGSGEAVREVCTPDSSEPSCATTRTYGSSHPPCPQTCPWDQRCEVGKGEALMGTQHPLQAKPLPHPPLCLSLFSLLSCLPLLFSLLHLTVLSAHLYHCVYVSVCLSLPPHLISLLFSCSLTPNGLQRRNIKPNERSSWATKGAQPQGDKSLARGFD